MKRFNALLIGGLLTLVLAAPSTSLAATTKKKPAKKKQPDAAAVVPSPADVKPSTKGLEEKLKKDEAEIMEPTRLAPAELPSRAGAPVTKDDLADKRRDDAIEQIKKILPKQKNPEIRAELLFQLGEFWWEKSRYVKFNQEMKAYEVAAQEWKDCREKNGDKKCGAEPRPNTRKSELFRANAVNLYQQIIKEFPQYKRVDEIRFILAYNMSEMALATDNKALKEKIYKQAIDAYKSLIALNPKSDYVSDALVELGNYYFDHNDLSRAEKAFTDAFNKHNKKTETYALYKLAWCRYNQGDYADTVKKLKDVAGRSDADEKGSRIKLKTEAMRDLVLAFAKNGERDSAIKYFVSKAGHDGSRTYIIRLASEFFTAGGAQYDDAVKTYQWLLSERPFDPYAPEWQSKIVLCFDKKGNRAKVREEIEHLVAKYGKGSDWEKGQGKDKAGVDHVRQARELTEEALYNLVTDYHQEAIKTKSVATYTLARDIYKKYIDNFPETERAYQMRFYYAEILFALEDYQPAYDQYVKVAEDKEQKQLKTTAAKNMLIAAERLVGIENGTYQKVITDDSKVIDEGKSKGDIKDSHMKMKVEATAEKKDLTKLEQQLVTACDHYADLVPDAEDEAHVRLRAAVMFLDKYQYVAASERFGYIIKKWPEEETSRTAAALILEALEAKQEWEQLNLRANEFVQNKKLLEGEKKGKGDFKAKLQIYIEGSTFKLAAALQNKDDAKAAQLFHDFFNNFPKSKFAPIAGYNAFIAYQKAKQLDTAIDIGEKLFKLDKETPKGIDSDAMRTLPNAGTEVQPLRPVILPDLTFRLAKTYELTADFEKAAKTYEQYVKDFPNDKQTPDAQFNAALWYKGLGENDKAIAALNKYIDMYKKKPAKEREEENMLTDSSVQWTICQIYESEKDWAKFIKCTETDYLAKYNAAGRTEPHWQVLNAKYREFLANKEVDAKQKMTDLATFIKQYYGIYLSADEKAKDSSKVAIAHVSFYLLEPEFDHYEGLKFKSPAAPTMKSDLQAKAAAQKALVAKYTEIVKYGNGDWAIAALVRIGMLPRLFANALRLAPVPKNLDADQKDMYKSSIEDKALEIETPSVDLLQKAMSKSFELGIYNEWTVEAQTALAEFKPELVGATHTLPLKGSEFFYTLNDGSGGAKVAPSKPVDTKPADTKPAATDASGAGSGGGR